LDKQAFQLYYGARRLKNYQLKHIGLNAKKLGQKNRISLGKVFFHLMENRLEMALYRTGLVFTLGQARRLQATSRVKVNDNLVKNLGYNLKHNDTIKVDSFKSLEILARYLKFNTPFFYFQNRDSRKHGLFVRKEFVKSSFFYKTRLPFLFSTKGHFVQFQPLQINGSSSIIPKTFSKNTNINVLLLGVTKLAWPKKQLYPIVYSNNKIKTCVYKFLKSLKTCKRHVSHSHLFGWKLQLTGFYTSLVEKKKKRILGVLRKNISLSKSTCLVEGYFQKPAFTFESNKKRKNLLNLTKGLTNFSNLYSNYSNLADNRQVFFNTLKTRRFFSNIFFSRIFLYAAKGKTKYRTTFYLIFKRKRKIDSLFHVCTLSSLKFRDIRKLRKKFYKKMAWKIKKYKKWRRHIRVSFSLFRLRQKLSQTFYVPKHFEINYKTFSANYLGYTDSKTTNTKIAFWLNLRKLLTFIT
jgi:ribosomal protein S4